MNPAPLNGGHSFVHSTLNSGPRAHGNERDQSLQPPKRLWQVKTHFFLFSADEISGQFAKSAAFQSACDAISQKAIHVSMGLIASGVLALLILRAREKTLDQLTNQS